MPEQNKDANIQSLFTPPLADFFLPDTTVKDSVAEQGAKEKAKELIFKFMITPFTTQLPTATAKHYAILCVDAILNALPEEIEYRENDGSVSDVDNPSIAYWKQVRQYIINN